MTDFLGEILQIILFNTDNVAFARSFETENKDTDFMFIGTRIILSVE